MMLDAPTVAENRLANPGLPGQVNDCVIDHVPAALRQAWADAGIYRGQDLFGSFLDFANQRPLALAVADKVACLSYAQLRARSLSLATALHALDVRAGDVVAVNQPNGWRACAVDLAVAALGAVVLPYPLGRKAHESRALLRKSGAKLLICERMVGETDYAALIDALRPELPALQTVVVRGDRYRDWPDLDQTWEGSPFAYQHGVIDADGPVRLMASSGTESEPKLVLYSHNSLIGGQASYLTSLGAHVADMRALFCVPLASPFGSLGTSCTLAAMGGALVNLERFDPEQTLRIAASHGVTHLFAGPNMVDMLLACPLLSQPGRGGLNLSALQAIVSGGSALSADTARRVREVLGCALIQSYGSADGVACHTALDDSIDTTVSTVGRPDPAVVSVRIMDEAEQPLGPGQEGEIWARGPMTPMCYYGALQLDRKYRAADGWVRTGDRGALDDTGRLRIAGRRADTVLRSGIKVNLVEIEMLLHEHPAVAEVAVVQAAAVGAHDARLCACVVLRAHGTALTLDDLNHFLLHERGVERYKRVDALLFCPRLPLAPSGKVNRAALARQAAATDTPAAGHALSAQPILELLTGVERAGVLRAAIELRLFNHLAAGAKTAQALAGELGASVRGTRILLDALAGLDLIVCEGGQEGLEAYGLSALSRRFLVGDSAQYVGGLAQVYTADLMWDTFRHFKDAVVAGKSVLPMSLEAADHPYWQQFAVGIANTSRTTAKRVSDLLQPWAAGRQSLDVLDMACSNGIYGFTLAQAHPHVRVCGVDWPSVLPSCQRMAHDFGVSERARFIGGDLFSVEIPGQYDLVIMSQILHHFDAQACRHLIERAWRCLAPGGRMVVCDFMMAGTAPTREAIPRLFGAQMLGLTEAGECYPVRFITALLAEQGFGAIEAVALKGLPVHCVMADRTAGHMAD